MNEPLSPRDFLCKVVGRLDALSELPNLKHQLAFVQQQLADIAAEGERVLEADLEKRYGK